MRVILTIDYGMNLWGWLFWSGIRGAMVGLYWWSLNPMKEMTLDCVFKCRHLQGNNSGKLQRKLKKTCCRVIHCPLFSCNFFVSRCWPAKLNSHSGAVDGASLQVLQGCRLQVSLCIKSISLSYPGFMSLGHYRLSCITTNPVKHQQSFLYCFSGYEKKADLTLPFKFQKA